ncbi:phosphoglycerate mutase-like protein [Podospora appendiculata]|uniref:Phosphoglycerate mutase-like protein n=1 Tax=Podospora appendiculata TaxID=314037 RepID=A0AAE1C8V7_9PEZI|nr:phosphoglycerate mutase-like protein [Podospora appendiculata]
MGKPRLIILIRHAQSEGNKNRDIHQTIPDHRVKLTQDGWQQAYDAGRQLRKMLRADDTLHFFTSPYRRTRETTEGILATLTSDEPEPSPFRRNNIKVYEEPRLREQDFGNFQPCSAEMERMWQERADYGHFFYRIPNGESAADAYDRISGFNESLWRQFGEDDFASVCVLVTHGLMSRVFLMKWYHFSVEYFEDLRNVNHCEFLIMRKEENGKYLLENNLRTWSDLRRERALLAATKEGAGAGAAPPKENGSSSSTTTTAVTTSKDSSKLDRAPSSTPNTTAVNFAAINTPPVEMRRRWGGCPNGCDHDKNFKIRQTLADLVQSDHIISSSDVLPACNTASADNIVVKVTAAAALVDISSTTTSTPTPSSAANPKTNITMTAAAEHPMTSTTHGIADPSFNGTANSHTLASRRPTAVKRNLSLPPQQQSADQTSSSCSGAPQIDITKAREEVVSSPDGTPSFITVEDRLRNHLRSPNTAPRPLDNRMMQLHVGRDFGGTYSGHNSVVASDADSSEDDDQRMRRLDREITNNGGGVDVNGDGASNGTPANGLSPLPPQYLHQRDSSRDKSKDVMRRRANRLGDHPHSSDGEHEADGEHEDDEEEEKDGSVSPCSLEDEEEAQELARTLTDEADQALRERAERGVLGSVY